MYRNIRPASDWHYKFEVEVLVFLEEAKKWAWTYIVMDCKTRQFMIRWKDDTRRQIFSTFRIKRNYNNVNFEDNVHKL